MTSATSLPTAQRGPFGIGSAETVAVGRITEVKLGKMLQPSPMSEHDVEVQYLNAKAVQWEHVDLTDPPLMWAGSDEVNDYAVRLGDLLVCEGGEAGRCCVSTASMNALIFQNSLHRLRPNGSTDLRFVRYSLRSLADAGWFDVLCNRATIAHLTREKLAAVRIPAVSADLQRDIADFLDRETQKIDSLVSNKQRLVNLLREKRGALVSHVVTKGLDPTAPTRDSDAEWFGWVPCHWPTIRLGHVARVVNGSTPSRDNQGYWDDGTVPWLASSKVNEDTVTEPSELITERAMQECSLMLMPAGSVILGLVGQGRTRAMAALLGIDSTINQNMAAAIPKSRILGRYLRYQFEHLYVPLRERGRGSNQAALNCEVVAAIRLPIPPLEEQEAAVRFIDEQAIVMQSLSEKTEATIERLQECRSALITAAVTGQIDVRTYRRDPEEVLEAS